MLTQLRKFLGQSKMVFVYSPGCVGSVVSVGLGWVKSNNSANSAQLRFAGAELGKNLV